MILALEAGHRLRAVVRKAEQIEKLKMHPRVQPFADNLEFVVVQDLSQKYAFDSVLTGVGAILHLASPLAIEVNSKQNPTLD